MNTKELGWKENHGIQAIENSHRNVIIDQRPELKISEKYITELFDRVNRPEDQNVQPEEEADTDQEGGSGKSHQADEK
jgi:hypothetical protein